MRCYFLNRARKLLYCFSLSSECFPKVYFIPDNIIPFTKYRCINTYPISNGINEIVDAASVAPYSMERSPTNMARPTDSVRISTLFVNIKG